MLDTPKLGVALAMVSVLAAMTSGARAQSRPSTLGMTCAQARGVVGTRGGIVLGTGGYTYDRFVSDARFCLNTETIRPAWAPTRDSPQCFIGYTCVEADYWLDH